MCGGDRRGGRLYVDVGPCLRRLQNSPLYVRTFDVAPEEELAFQYIAHVALDLIEEKLRNAASGAAKDDMYLGFLGPIEEYRVYAYATSTNIKFVAIMQDSPSRESELRSLFVELHKLYVQTMSNPFAAIGEPIASKQFDAKLSALVQQHNTTA